MTAKTSKNNTALPPKTFKQAQARLGRLKGFQPKKLISGLTEEKIVDDFAITLSLVFNDAKTIDVLSSIHGNSKPSNIVKPNKRLGEYVGISKYLLRANISLIHELLNKLKETAPGPKCPSPNSYIFHIVHQTALYQEILKLMPPAGKKMWIGLVNIANNRPTAAPYKNTLRMIRNWTFSHYDFQQIPRGYSSFFIPTKNIFNRKALLSNGKQLWSVRFFYADASVDGQIEALLGNNAFDVLENERQGISNYVMFGIYSFLTTYLSKFKNLKIID